MSAPTLIPTAGTPTAGAPTLNPTAGAELVEAVRGRPTGRRRPSGELHAVPRTDRTRTALCGARVGGQGGPWVAPRTGTCPECRALVPVPAPSGAPA